MTNFYLYAHNGDTMKQTNIYLTEQQRKRLKELAKETGLTAAEHVRRAIDAYLGQLLENFRLKN